MSVNIKNLPTRIHVYATECSNGRVFLTAQNLDDDLPDMVDGELIATYVLECVEEVVKTTKLIPANKY